MRTGVSVCKLNKIVLLSLVLLALGLLLLVLFGSSSCRWKCNLQINAGGAMIYVWKLDKLIFPAWVSNICIKPWIGLQMFINCVCHNSVKRREGGSILGADAWRGTRRTIWWEAAQRGQRRIPFHVLYLYRTPVNQYERSFFSSLLTRYLLSAQLNIQTLFRSIVIPTQTIFKFLDTPIRLTQEPSNFNVPSCFQTTSLDKEL